MRETKSNLRRHAGALLLAALLACAVPWPAATAAPPASAPDAAPAVRLEALPIGRFGKSPWAIAPGWFVLLAVLLPGALWTGLAWKRAFDTDPVRRRRRGVRELRGLLRELQRRPGAPPQPRQLYRWFDAVARAWDLDLAAPTPADLERAIATLGGDAAQIVRWRDLWCAAERRLFAPSAALPADWPAQAAALAGELAMPRRRHRFPDRRAYWLPALLALPLAFAAATPESARGAAPQAPAGGGTASVDTDLDEAYAASLKALETNAMDWAAHENVARHDIRAQDWDGAVAHALAAFLLHASAATRDDLRQALGQAATADPALKRLFAGAWYERLPTWLAPRGWQQLALAASVLLAAGLAALVLGLYHRERRTALLCGAPAACAAVLLAGVSLYGWSAYGDLRRPGAAVVLRPANLSPVPTNLVPQDETSPVAAGRVVLHLRSFLGWEQVAADREHAGWLRANAILPLYADRWSRPAARTPEDVPPAARAGDAPGA